MQTNSKCCFKFYLKIDIFVLIFIQNLRTCLVIIIKKNLSFILKNIKYGVFKKYLLLVLYHFYLFFKDYFKKIIIQLRRMIKNKTLNIKLFLKPI